MFDFGDQLDFGDQPRTSIRSGELSAQPLHDPDMSDSAEWWAERMVAGELWRDLAALR